MSLPAIQANSLSALTALASNPPSYPRNPTHVRHEPLVLYIARVPGSKDVFLSPMKPREKVVTAEDIQSSLYYVHIETPEDADYVSQPRFKEPEYSAQPHSSSVQSSAPSVPRKAVPARSSYTGRATAPLRKPVPGTLTPRVNIEDQQNSKAGYFAQRQDTLTPGSISVSQTGPDNIENCRLGPGTQSSLAISPSTGTSLTLIRRDPVSGNQWNVAQIDDPIVPDISSSSNGSVTRRKPGAPMYIDVLNPGYSKFLHSDNVNTNSLRGPNDNLRNVDQSGPTSSQEGPIPCQDTRQDPNVFRRRIWMEGAQTTSSGFGHRSRGSYDQNSGQSMSRGSWDAQSQRASTDMRLSLSHSPSFLTREDQSYGTIQVSDRQRSFRGYVFTSPWNGRCEFVTGAGGGSLKCRHVISGPQGASSPASSVSELRFNLPSSSTPSKLRADETSKRSSLFHRGRHSRNNSTFSLSQENGLDSNQYSEDRMDLSLGQEFAGGGFGGKQAKLGKIIIEDEGLKMIDLVVAANLGLWWRAYERALSPSSHERGGL